MGRMKGVRLTTERLIVRDLPPRAAQQVARFHHENWHYHRQWEPFRGSEYFTAPVQRRVLRYEARSDSKLHLWLLLRDGRRRRWRDLPIVGSLALSSIERASVQSCLLGYKIDARYARRGYMHEALVAVITHAFTTMGLHRIEATVMPRNRPSRALLERLGFREEGCARELILIQGVWEDHLRNALLSGEWTEGPDKSGPRS